MQFESPNSELALQENWFVPNNSGLCQCGCGEKTSIADYTDKKRGWLKGHNRRYRSGHGQRGKYIDATGEQYNNLTAILWVKPNYWVFKCNCGNEKVIRYSHVKQGLVKSCGCFNTKILIKRNMTHGKSKTSEYKCWTHMKDRCFNINDKKYYRYGGRGITVCDEWKDNFESFYNYIGPKPKGRYSIDRINNDGNYEPRNVRWATDNEQANNKSTNKLQER